MICIVLHIMTAKWNDHMLWNRTHLGPQQSPTISHASLGLLLNLGSCFFSFFLLPSPPLPCLILSHCAALRCYESESSSHPDRAFLLLPALFYFSFGCRRHCCTAGVGAALLPPRRSRSLWPRPPWVFLLKVTTSLFKNSAEKEKTLYPTLWAVISRRTF